MEQGRPARCVELDPFKPTFLKRDAHSLCELQASQPRLEVGSNEAPRRQPTCHLVQVLIGSPRPERGFLKLCAVCAFFFSVPSQGKRTEFFCCYPSVHLDTFLQNDWDSIFSPILFLYSFCQVYIVPKKLSILVAYFHRLTTCQHPLSMVY